MGMVMAAVIAVMVMAAGRLGRLPTRCCRFPVGWSCVRATPTRELCCLTLWFCRGKQLTPTPVLALALALALDVETNSLALTKQTKRGVRKKATNVKYE
jgi:hypothetical protein